jgi:type IX secretion system PorP/SprF family membrane protein
MNSNIKNFIRIIVLVALAIKINAQDKHFSQFDAAPLYYNPALAGVYDGEHRFMGNIKHQWKIYETYMLSYDRMLPKKVSIAGGFFGAGIMINHDVAGENKYGTSELNLIPAFHRPIISNKVMLSVGTGLKFFTNSVDDSKVVTPDMIDPATGEIKPEFAGFETTRVYSGDLSLGVNLHYVIAEKHPSNLGITWFNLAKMGGSFTEADATETPRRFSVNANSEFKLSEDLKLLPSLIYMYQVPYDQINGGTYLRYDLAKRSKVVKGIYIGGWYRVGDAVITGIAFDFPGFQETHSFNVGLSYDINVSDYRKSQKWDPTVGTAGSFEVSLKYIIKGAPFSFETPGIINEPVF